MRWVNFARRVGQAAQDPDFAKKAALKATSDLATKEAKILNEEADKRGKDSVAPTGAKLQDVGKTCAKGLNPD